MTANSPPSSRPSGQPCGSDPATTIDEQPEWVRRIIEVGWRHLGIVKGSDTDTPIPFPYCIVGWEKFAMALRALGTAPSQEEAREVEEVGHSREHPADWPSTGAQQRLEWVAAALHGNPVSGVGATDPLVKMVVALRAAIQEIHAHGNRTRAELVGRYEAALSVEPHPEPASDRPRRDVDFEDEMEALETKMETNEAISMLESLTSGPAGDRPTPSEEAVKAALLAYCDGGMRASIRAYLAVDFPSGESRRKNGTWLNVDTLTEDDYRGLGLFAATGTAEEVKEWLTRRALRVGDGRPPDEEGAK